jgi:uncharacterized membrane protein
MQSASSSLLHYPTISAFVLHIGAGATGLVSGTVAAIARKGNYLHRKAGSVFVVSMLVMALFAAYLAVAIPDQIVNLFISTLVAYLVTTAWMTVHRKQDDAGLSEKIALIVAIALWTPFAILSFQLATGMAPLFKSAIPFEGPVLVAIYSFTAILTFAVVGDARLVLAGGILGAPRIARHLWRMCFGLTLAVGCAFSNGFARLLPGPYHVPLYFHLPKLLPLSLPIFWFIRVRFTRWHRNAPGLHAPTP